MIKLKNLIEGPADDISAAMDKPLGQAVADLKKISHEPGFRNTALAGVRDGTREDEKLPFKNQNISNARLFPTQKEIGVKQSLLDILKDRWDVIDKIFNPPVILSDKSGPTPLLVANINGKFAILDGHHRWSTCFMAYPGVEMQCSVMQAPPDMGVEDALKTMQLAIAGKAGKVVTVPFEGFNIMTANEEDIIQYVIDNIENTCIEKFRKYRPKIFANVNTNNEDELKRALAQYFAKNVPLIKKRQGPFPRIVMPQAGDSGVKQSDVNASLQKGSVNFKEPFPAKESVQKRMDNILKESIIKTKRK